MISKAIHNLYMSQSSSHLNPYRNAKMQWSAHTITAPSIKHWHHKGVGLFCVGGSVVDELFQV